MLYFAYGSNMHHLHMKRRCPDTLFLGKAILGDYRLAFLYPSTSFPGGGAADIVRAPGSVVEGALYRSTAKDLRSLDRYEDLHIGGYRRLEVAVLFRDQRMKAVTYEVVDKLAKELAPTTGYRDLLLEGSQMSGLSEAYQKKLKRLAQ